MRTSVLLLRNHPSLPWKHARPHGLRIVFMASTSLSTPSPSDNYTCVPEWACTHSSAQSPAAVATPSLHRWSAAAVLRVGRTRTVAPAAPLAAIPPGVPPSPAP